MTGWLSGWRRLKSISCLLNQIQEVCLGFLSYSSSVQYQESLDWLGCLSMALKITPSTPFHLQVCFYYGWWSHQLEFKEAAFSCTFKYRRQVYGHMTKEAIWIQQFLHDIHFPLPNPTTLLVNNQGAIALASTPTFHTQMKHIRV